MQIYNSIYFVDLSGRAVGYQVRGPSPQHGDLRRPGPPSGLGIGGGAQTCDRRVPIDLKGDSLSTLPPMSPTPKESMHPYDCW
ncbi:hypothetical protein PoB_005573000 [Plakobranchus ocellatus]|uniref:Uncharacterized protein n=1 Tax=Plakobranchus ocellatus TaxID=259542 RepID=A0AAV4CC32_9GAST|nr:hypothetical protein PoB_005573000 [Plakobranchus ocellatus]